MTRKLLPYEYDLIAALGITKEEYLDFLAVQQQYTDPKAGTVFDITDGPAVAIVLAIIGVIFQVVSVLLMPRPQIPSQQAAAGQTQTREQRFSPRFGFNSAQELAKYGDTVPLVYTDRTVNTAGGVRVAGALLWSAVRSFGSNQFLQMLMVLAGGPIVAIDANKSAFGQTAITDLIAQNKWLYFQPGSTGPLRFRDETADASATDPTVYGGANDNPYRLQPTTTNTRVDGFSQAYSPSSSATFGGYSPVPLNVKTYLRNSTGDKGSRDLGITVSNNFNWNTSGLTRIEIGNTMRITIASTANEPTGTTFEDDLTSSAMDARRGYASVFDDAGIFKLGSARFRVSNVAGTSTDEGDLTIDLTCIEAGNAPVLPYTYDEVVDTSGLYVNNPAYISARDTTNAVLNADERGEITTAQEMLASPGIYKAYSYAVQTESWNEYAWYDEWSGAYYTTATGFNKERDLTTAEIAALNNYVAFEATATGGSDELYYLKALVRIEEATYSTLTKCNIADIAMRCQHFRRISGRQQVYGSGQRAGYPASDNGIHSRVALFVMRYRIAAQSWSYMPGIFAVRRAADQDNYIYVKFDGGATAEQWQFQFEPVVDPIAEVTERPFLRLSTGQVRYYYIQNSGDPSTIALSDGRTIYFTGFYRDSVADAVYPLPPINQSPNGTNEWDWFSLDADTQLTTSFDRGPEFAITAVSEQQRETFTSRLYSNLALAGLNVFSGKSLQDMRSFTAFVSQGKPVRRLNTDTLSYPSTPDGASCFAPDIFLDTVIDSIDGIGNYAELAGIDTEQLAITKRFCRANNLFMDGLIADRQSWREFWAQAAPFSLLEFARIGGRETLIPAVPYNRTTGVLDRRVDISALFNQGNILEDSYKEEFMDYDANVQDMVATVIYRTLDSNGIFFTNRSVSIQRSDTNESDAVRETFDLSAFVTTESQAILFGKLLCNVRRYVRSGIEFKTYPTTSPVSPGAYIYVDIGLNAWDGVRTGTIGAGGALNIPLDNAVPNGTYNVLLYRSGNDVVSTTATISSNTASSLASREGWLFVLGTTVKTKRVFRVSDVQMDEEGQVTVRGTIFPCDANDNALISDFSDNLFTVRR